MTINETLAERGQTHGNYPEQAKTAQALKAIMRSTPNWSTLPDPLKESLELIATKISRSLHGNPLYDDVWRDISGYATLAERLCNGKEEVGQDRNHPIKQTGDAGLVG